MSVEIRAATLDAESQVFDAYRQFYAQPPDPQLATAFLLERLGEGSSLLLVALKDACEVIGFTQLYPIFDSVSATRSFVLYDL